MKVIQCKIEIDRPVKRCEMFSHTMDEQFSYRDVSQDARQRMHTFEIARTYITGLLSNQTASRSIVLAGHDNDRQCLFRFLWKLGKYHCIRQNCKITSPTFG